VAFTDPHTQQLIALIRRIILEGGEFTTALEGQIAALIASVLTTRGDIIYRDDTTAARLAKGTTGQFLKQGADDPEWATVSVVELWSWLIEFPDDKDYDFIINLPFPGSVNSTTTISAAGTCIFTGKINTTALGGTANSVSTSEQEQAHTTANAFVAGDNFRGTVSGNSGCENMTVTVKVTRTI
jgi:hypothetical protein